MKNLVILFLVVLLIFFIGAVLYAVTREQTPKKNVRNFKVRFDAANEKYYIVNELDTYDEPVTNFIGKRVMYKEKPKAEFVCEKLNS